jgi:type IV pilus biogenesis protein CpaD/CtpE
MEATMFIRTLIPICLIAALVMFPSCAANNKVALEAESRLEKNWGRSYESAKYNQMLNPEAGKTPAPVTGIDGEAAEKNVQKYRKSFDKEPAQGSQGMNVGIIKSMD